MPYLEQNANHNLPPVATRALSSVRQPVPAGNRRAVFAREQDATPQTQSQGETQHCIGFSLIQYRASLLLLRTRFGFTSITLPLSFIFVGL